MSKRKSLEERYLEFISKAKEKYGDQYTFEKVEYVDSRTPVIITCKDHGEFNRKPSLFLYGRACAKCNASKTKHGTDIESRIGSFIRKAKGKYKNQYDYSFVHETYVDRNSEVKILCKDHGEFSVRPAYHLSNNGTSGCKGCGNWIPSATKSFLSEKSFSKIIEKVSKNKYSVVEGTFRGVSKECDFICSEHGEFTRIARTIKNGGYCPDCFKQILKETNTKSLDVFIEESKSVYGDAFSYTNVEYVNDKTPISLNCNKHKEEFEITPRRHLDGDIGCNKCRLEMTREKSKDVKLKMFIQQLENSSFKNLKFDADEFVNFSIPISFICSEHGLFIKAPQAVVKTGCGKCGNEAYHMRVRKEILDRFFKNAKEKHGDRFEYLSEVVSMDEEIEIRCKKHNLIYTQTPRKHLQNNHDCFECYREFQTESSITTGTTKEHDKLRRRKVYKDWRTAVLSRYNVCDCCGSSEQLFAHHLYSFDSYPELRYDVDNGVGLCKNCHERGFHKEYGFGDNTKEQYIEFKNSHIK